MIYKTEILDSDSYVCGGTVYRGTDAVGKMCRDLKTGALEVYRNSQISFIVPDIASRAKKSLIERDSLNYVKYSPNPFAKIKKDVS